MNDFIYWEVHVNTGYIPDLNLGRPRFTNILQVYFTQADPKSTKRQSTQAAFALLGSAHVKTACKNVDEATKLPDNRMSPVDQ